MKFRLVSLAAMVAALSLPGAVDGMAQSAPAAAESEVTVRPSSQTATQAAAAQTSAQENSAVTDRYLIPVATELTSKLDSRSAAVGQQVTAKTTQAASLADGRVLPKGTKLVGHVARVQAQTSNQPYAMLAITFDQAELKGGQSVALRSVIGTVTPPVRLPESDSPMMDAAGPIGAGGGANASAGGLGSASTRGGVGVSGSLPPGPVRSVGPTAGTTLGRVGSGVDPVAGSVADIPGGVVGKAGETVSAAPRATGLPGVMLSNSAAESAGASGTLTAAGRNIQLESGTQITMGVIAR
jgi:hypothetical protein